MLLALSVVLALSGLEGSDTKPPAAFSLEWNAPESCPSGETVESLIDELVEDQLDGEGTMEVVGTLTPDAGGYRLDLTTTIGTRESARELHAPGCEELAHSAALVVAIIMVPTFSDGPQESGAQPGPEAETWLTDEFEAGPGDDAEPMDIPPVASPPPREAPQTSARRIAPWVRAGLGVDAGGNPSAALASRLGLGLSWPHLRIGVEGTHVAPRRARGTDATAGLVQQGMLGLSACGVVTLESWAFPLCGGVEVGVLRADSRGVEPASTATGFVATPLLRAGGLRRWGRVGAWVDTELLVRAATTSVVIAETEIFRPNPAWFRMLVGIEVSLGKQTGRAGQGLY